MYLRIRSKNLSAGQLRHCIYTPKRGVFRLGSMTPNENIFTKKQLDKGIIEINTVKAVANSNSKDVCKVVWSAAYLPTAEWCFLDDLDMLSDTNDLPLCLTWLPKCFSNGGHGVIVKHIHSSRGKGIYRFETKEELDSFYNQKRATSNFNYIVEKYYTYSREYRLHVDQFGCFHANRKMLKTDATDRWHRHHSNTVWIREENELFNKPDNWDEIVATCQKARECIGLDICSFDVKVQNSRTENPKFIILESNSGSALGEETIEKYKIELERIAQYKYDNNQFSFR